MDTTDADPILPVTRLDCRFELDGPPRLPVFAGSAWRGAFGHALKKAVCVVRHTDCASCLLYRSCVYPYLFETPPPPDAAKMRRYTAAPHPYALRIEPRQTGPAYRLGITLFGRADRHVAYVIHALAEAGKAGLGRDRQPFHLSEVLQAAGSDLDQWDSIYAPNQPLELRFRTMPARPRLPGDLDIRLISPLRLRHQDRLVTPANFRFADWFGPLLRRISMLSYFHTETPLEVDFAALTRAADAVPIHAPQLRWYDWTRYSSRQDTTMDMGGMMGSFRLPAALLEPFWPYLWLGQFTQVGKGTTMGLGRFEIQPARAPGEVA